MITQSLYHCERRKVAPSKDFNYVVVFQKQISCLFTSLKGFKSNISKVRIGCQDEGYAMLTIDMDVILVSGAELVGMNPGLVSESYFKAWIPSTGIVHILE